MSFIANHGHIGLIAMGAVFLAVTGGEALYADLGHFGRRPIQRAWLGLVLPSLLINYFGQGALVLSHPSALENPFYRMVPEILLLPLGSRPLEQVARLAETVRRIGSLSDAV